MWITESLVCLFCCAVAFSAAVFGFAAHAAHAAQAEGDGVIDLTQAVVVLEGGGGPVVEAAGQVLVEEVARRAGLNWPLKRRNPGAPAIVLALDPKASHTPDAPEAYAIEVECNARTVRIYGRDARGVLFGVGRLLRKMAWEPGRVAVDASVAIRTRPAFPIRGHQLGYRATANSYDAWNEAQYDQYIRELALFGCNMVEAIPFQDDDSVLMPVPREVMNVRISEICHRYGLDYWIWTPAVFDLNDQALRAAELDRHEAYYAQCPRIDGVFFPGGDPGNNPPGLVMPFLEDVAKRLAKYHPKGGVWISFQGFSDPWVDECYAYLDTHKPKWLAGVVAGPSAPTMPETRARLPRQYRLRHYPDITHTLLCEYPVPWWDPAYALTLGREPVNPRPTFYQRIFEWSIPGSDGFGAYSDGIHDDVNKALWSLWGWNPALTAHEILSDYARFFFRSDMAGDGADALMALEGNWEGPLAQNGGVSAAWEMWERLNAAAPELESNWRWRMHLFRARYDRFVRERQRYEVGLEAEANAALARAAEAGANAVIGKALAALARADANPALNAMRRQLEEDGQALFEQIGYQTSVEKYHARNAERGAVLDFLDRPLNNRWWLEDQFKEVRELSAESDKAARLNLIAHWEDPGPGGFYDDIGNTGKCPRVVREDWRTDPELTRIRQADFNTWMDGCKSRLRLSMLSYMDWPAGLVYEGLDPGARYILRVTGRGDAIPLVDGRRLEATTYSKAPDEFKEFPVPQRSYATGRLEVKWEKPCDGPVNWRQASILTEVWLLKRP